jgi:hypothetical protein
MHLLDVKLKVTASKAIQDETAETKIYFKGFDLVNGTYKLFGDKLIFKGLSQLKTPCEQLYIEVAIKEELVREEEPTPGLEGFLWMKNPFYLREHGSGLEHKLPVELWVHEWEIPVLAKANLYLTSA